MLTLALALVAGAAGPALGIPPWPLGPDGELVAAPPGVPLEASGGAVEAVAPGLWRVVPDEGVRAVELRAGELRAVALVEPPPGRVTLAFAPPAPVKGRDDAVTVEVTVQTSAGEADADPRPPWITPSAGRLGPVEVVGPGRFRARFELPETRWPEAVAFVALAARCPDCATPRALGAAWLPVAAAIDLPGRTDPGVSTTVEVAGRRWGPVLADATGRFRVPVVVPPGAVRGTAHSVNARGNERHTVIQLGLPTVPRLACAVAPPGLPADGRARGAVVCTACAPDGKPAPGGRVMLAASRGGVGAVRWEGGLLRATYHAARGGSGPATLVATWREAGAAGHATVAIELATGAPAGIDWEVAGEPLRPGESAEVRAVARDERGDPLGPALARAGPGSTVAEGRLVARAALGDGVERIALSFVLPPTQVAARLSLRREGATWVAEARGLDGRPAVGVPLTFGGGATAVTDARGSARSPAVGPAEWVTGPAGLRAAGWSWAPPDREAIEVARQVEVALRPADSVDVAATVEGRWIRWSIKGPGGALAARQVLLRAGDVRLGPVEAYGGGGRCEVLGGHGPVAVMDEASGAAAVVVVP